MENLKLILSKYLWFIIVFAIFLVFIVTTILIVNKKGKKRTIFLYGMFMGFDNMQVLSLTMIVMNFLLLSFALASKQPLSLSIGIVSFLLIFIAFIVVKRALVLIINLLMNVVNIGILYFGHLIDELRITVGGSKYFILQVVIMTFGILYYLFCSLKYVKDIRKREKFYGKI